jgi:hypothetical protein
VSAKHRLNEPTARSTRKHRFIAASLGLYAVTLLSAPVHSADVITAKVTFTGTYGNGNLYVGLDTTISEPGCAQPRFDVSSTHPNFKQIFATAIAAAATGRAITIRAVGCFNGYPTLDQTNGSYFYVHAQ